MKIAVVVARVLLGLLFFAAGLAGFVFYSHPPPAPPGLAGQFQDVWFRSGWVLFVDATQLISGALLLANRYVVLALVLLGAVLANILAFHITMQPGGIFPGLIATFVWIFLAWHYRTNLAPIFEANVTPV